MTAKRKTHSAAFKAKVALEALRDQKSVNEIAGKYDVHPTQVSTWKRQAMENMAASFGQSAEKVSRNEDALKERLMFPVKNGHEPLSSDSC